MAHRKRGTARVEDKFLDRRSSRMARTTFELTAPLRFPLGRRQARRGNGDPAVMQTHKLIANASDTLRL